MKQVQFFHSGGTDSNDPLAEAERTVETAQERFDRLLAKQRAKGRAEAEAAGMVEGILGSFRRGLDRRIVEDVEAHADRIVEAAWRGTHFEIDDIPDGAQLLVVVQKGGGPAQVPADHIGALLPPIQEDNTAPR